MIAIRNNKLYFKGEISWSYHSIFAQYKKCVLRKTMILSKVHKDNRSE